MGSVVLVLSEPVGWLCLTSGEPGFTFGRSTTLPSKWRWTRMGLGLLWLTGTSMEPPRMNWCMWRTPQITVSRIGWQVREWITNSCELILIYHFLEHWFKMAKLILSKCELWYDVSCSEDSNLISVTQFKNCNSYLFSGTRKMSRVTPQKKCVTG